MNNHGMQITDARSLGKGCAGSRVIRRWSPAARVAGKDLNGVTAYLLRNLSSLDGFGVGGHMTTKARSRVTLYLRLTTYPYPRATTRVAPTMFRLRILN